MAERLLPKQAPKASHGRGGAGNIGPTVNNATKTSLTTPTIKSNVYTTGRGGSGNMKKNDPKHPEVARKSQDVEPPVKRRAIEERGHTGRGGAANIIRPSIDQVTRGADERAVIEEGMMYDRQRKEVGGPDVTHGDWWRDEMAEGNAVRRR
ncbi:MAG: hypothetical protein Q9166_007792 [cf. Caloplaca sp. 2 TL-2023]